MRLVVIFVILLSHKAFAVSLSDAASEVVRTHPSVIERLNNFNSVSQDIKIAEAGYYPSMSYLGSFGIENVKSSSTGFSKKTSEVMSNTFSMSQNLFRGFETSFETAKQRKRVYSAAYSYVEVANDHIFKMAKNYVDVLRYKELLKIGRDNIDLHEATFLQIQQRQEAGTSALSEVERVAGRLALANSNYIVDNNNFQDALFGFEGFIGRFIPPEAYEMPDLEVVLPQSLEKALQIALSYNPSLGVAQYKLEAAHKSYEITKAPYYPSVDMEVLKTWNKNQAGVAGNAETASALVTLSYNFFNGGRDEAQRKKELSLIHQEDKSLSKLRREVIEGLQLSWSAYELVSRQQEFLLRHSHYTKRTLEAYREEFSLGRRSLVDLLDAEAELNTAHSKLINVEYDILYAKMRILDAMGLLSGALEINVKPTVGLRANDLLDIGMVKQDTLPLIKDSDKDGIPDSIDECVNSVHGIVINTFGCAQLSLAELDARMSDLNLSLLDSENIKSDIDDLEALLADDGMFDDEESLFDDIDDDLEETVFEDEVVLPVRIRDPWDYWSKDEVGEGEFTDDEIELFEMEHNITINLPIRYDINATIPQVLENEELLESNELLLIDEILEEDETLLVNEEMVSDENQNEEYKITFETIRSSAVRDSEGGRKVMVLLKGRRFTSVKKSGEWYKIYGYYFKDKWIMSETDLWTHESNVKVLKDE